MYLLKRLIMGLLLIAGAGLWCQPAFAVATEKAVSGGGQFALLWNVARSDSRSTLKDILDASGVEQRLSAFVEGSLRLIADTRITVYGGNERYFDARSNQSFIPVSVLAQIYSSVSSRYVRTDIRHKIFASSVEQLYWYELGRILVSQFALPIRGAEEYALDSFATSMLLNLRDNDYFLDAAEEYLVVDDASHLLQQGRFQNEFEFDRSRYQLIVCTVLGKDALPYQETLESLAWKPERLRQCEQRYHEQLKDWYTALKDHLKAGNSVQGWLSQGRYPRPEE